ncbi:VanZ family protein [Oceanotoga sp. DSM 15011]|jgi:VanZ family protein|uniref:VanZ family protein n=1 Tax=Oceanotoga teriensis TaxID=515440 RepID=A0AA45HHU8_9BACT|nr:MULTISPECIES: VanZ family protein [Oceanotoga]MDN5342762.1 hypothetical protein [Oceanotoga sp.]MDO7975786.1 VanZ family protein [Oceanotoga teriensis]PWJ88067.1 VanZ family protein [Oceanotoga teriensis]UYO99203.1 VanZ family protein [Oceanotoga sp. DSM 15011]
MKNKKKKWFFIIGIILIAWVGVIFYFGSRNTQTSYNQSGAVYEFFKSLDNTLDITNKEWFINLESFLKQWWFGTDRVAGMSVLRKSAHFGIYMLLGFISSLFTFVYCRKYLISFLMGISFPTMIAAIDEYNQGFHDRGSSLHDVMIDLSGAVTGTLFLFLIFLIVFIIKHFKKKRNFENDKRI